MTEGNGVIDSEVAAMLLGISKNNLRQLVHRKQLVPTGRQKRRSLFTLADVLALQTRRSDSSGNESAL
jgi:DNA-binding transcriptional MerR regulator